MLGPMRSALAFSCWLIAVSPACSSDSNAERIASGGSSGSGEVGEGGAAGAVGGGMGGPAATAGRSSSEGPDMMAPLDMTANGGSLGSGAGAPDGGLPDAATAAGVCPPGPFAESPVPDGLLPQTVCSEMTFSEGPVWFDALGTLFFSDFQIGSPGTFFDGRILSHTPGGSCEEFIADAGTNGLAIAPDGNLLGCRHADQTLTIFDLTTRQPSVLIADNDGASFNSPNDVAVRSDGNLYFTDPTYLRGARPAEQPARVYWRDTSGALTVIDEGPNANGISLSPDESRLYVSHLGFGGAQNQIIVFDVAAGGAPSNPTQFVNAGSDGMAVDCAGNLYITNGGVQIYNPEGELVDTIIAPGAANVAFGGPERRTLYITAEESLLSIELAIPGLPY